MPTYVALLRAVNVGGTGKLPMAELRAMAEAAGFASVRTYIASGNLVLDADRPQAEIKAALEQALAAYAGKSVGMMVRSAAEMAVVVAANPFKDAPPNRTVAIFLDVPPPEGVAANATGLQDEGIACGRREIYVHYPSGQGQSKLQIPAAKAGTARNMNTVAKLAEMAAG